MRKLSLQQFAISLDGYICQDGTEFYRWWEGLVDEELDRYFVATLRRAHTHIMGRQTYLDMGAYWPTATDSADWSEAEIAGMMNDRPKVVFSKTLKTADWPQARIASGDTAEEISRLKQEPGGEIVAHGGATFVKSLARLGVVDEYRLYLMPFAAGSGVSLFGDLEHGQALRLASSRAFPCGVIEVVYEPQPPASGLVMTTVPATASATYSIRLPGPPCSGHSDRRVLATAATADQKQGGEAEGESCDGGAGDDRVDLTGALAELLPRAVDVPPGAHPFGDGVDRARQLRAGAVDACDQRVLIGGLRFDFRVSHLRAPFPSRAVKPGLALLPLPVRDRGVYFVRSTVTFTSSGFLVSPCCHDDSGTRRLISSPSQAGSAWASATTACS
jgi:dihydrofolate reductase